MFGFLRRKKPDPQAAPPPAASPATGAPPETDPSRLGDAPAPESVATSDAPHTSMPAAGGAAAAPSAVNAGPAADPAAPAQPGKLAGFLGRLLGTAPDASPEPQPEPAGATDPAAQPEPPARPAQAAEPTEHEPAAAIGPVAAPTPVAAPVPAELVPSKSESAEIAPAEATPAEATAAETAAQIAPIEAAPPRPVSLPSRFTRTTRPAPVEEAGPAQPEPAQPEPFAVESIAPSLPVQQPAVALLDEPTISVGERTSWVARLKQGLSKTRSNLGTLFVAVQVDEALFEDLETALLTADVGVEATMHLLAQLRNTVKKERLTEGEQVRRALKRLVAELLMPLEQPIDIDRADPLVMMIAGVNGAGKTTSIGKLARHLQRERKTVLLAAGDTFRAAAREQLAQWGERNGVAVIAQQGGDPAAVAFDAVAAAQARRIEVVIVDTAGRLPTQLHLMQELKKVHRVVAKAMPDAPHETLLVLDGNTGQNALAQVKAFDDAVPLTGLVVTKLDGTAKGGALIALAHTRRDKPIPVYFIGVGEGIEDLQAFSAEEFAEALFD